MDDVPASLDDVLITPELARRPTRSPDYAAEGRALTALAEVMAESPQAILQKLVQTALEMCRADSAGISLLETDGATEMFRCPAIAGLLANLVGEGMPRRASACGIVLDRNASLLFAYPERYFEYGMGIDPPIVEALFVPFQTEGKPVGMLWVVAHTPSRQFDAEDQRLLASLSGFAAVAYQMKTAQVMTGAGLKARADEVRQHKEAEAALRRSHSELERRHAELEQRTLQLRRLASQLTLAEQGARRQLASTLHDGLQQLLFSAGITLDVAMKTSSQDDHVALLQRARADVKEAVEAARTLSVNLFPPVLHVGGLPAALTWLARRTQEQYNVVVNVTADPQANPEARDVLILLFDAVRELLFNTVKHAGIDRVEVNLALGPGDTIQIQVSDEGVGFDPGATLHDKNQQQVGLGLFSIQERLALVGGHLDIQSAPGKGSRFAVTLPRTGLPGLAGDGTEAQRRDPGWPEGLVYDSASGTPKALRILIADDHAVARAGLRELFGKRHELQVVGEAASGVEAVTQAVALQPDVIVIDVSMPQMNGIDATREIHRTLRHIRIVGLSTHDDESTERLMRRAGAEAYFTKNEGTDRLLDYLLSLLATSEGASAG